MITSLAEPLYVIRRRNALVVVVGIMRSQHFSREFMHRAKVLLGHLQPNIVADRVNAGAVAAKESKKEAATKDVSFLGAYGMSKTISTFGQQIKSFAQEACFHLRYLSLDVVFNLVGIVVAIFQSLDFRGIDVSKNIDFPVDAMNKLLDDHNHAERKAFQRFLATEPIFKNKHYVVCINVSR